MKPYDLLASRDTVFLQLRFLALQHCRRPLNLKQRHKLPAGSWYKLLIPFMLNGTPEQSLAKFCSLCAVESSVSLPAWCDILGYDSSLHSNSEASGDDRTSSVLVSHAKRSWLDPRRRHLYYK
jgi:hypothetical protein